MKKYWFLCGLLLASITSVVLITGCGNGEPAKKVDLSQKVEEPLVPSPGTVKVAVGAMVSPRKTFADYQRLLEYISQKLGKPVSLIQRRSYEEVNDLLRTNSVDCAFVCSGPYVQVQQDFGVDILAVPVVDGKTVYGSYIVVNNASGIQSLEDLKGKSFVFASPLSLTGTQYPTSLLAEMGHTPEQYFSKITYAHTHDNSIKVVAENMADGAAVHSLIWEYFQATDPRYTSRTRIIHRSPEFGIPPVVVPRGGDPVLKKKLRTIFLALHEEEESREILKELRIDRFVMGNDAMYDSVRQMKALLEAARKAGSR